MTIDGESFTGILVDFEVDFDGSYGEDSITLDTGGPLDIAFKESEIAEIHPVASSDKEA